MTREREKRKKNENLMSQQDGKYLSRKGGRQLDNFGLQQDHGCIVFAQAERSNSTTRL